MAELDFAAWTHPLSGSDHAGISQTGADLSWATQVVRDPSLSLVSSNTRAKVADAGRYLVRYDTGLQFNAAIATTKTRSAVLANLRKNGTDQIYGRSLGYLRNAQGCNGGHLSGAAFLDLAAGDEVSVFAQRIDTETANAGATERMPNFEGQLSAWRLKDGWRLLRAKLNADESNSTASAQKIGFTVESADAGWAAVGDDFAFDPASAGGLYASSLSYVFLVAVSVEATASSTTSGTLLEVGLVQADTAGTALEFARVTSYAEGAGGCTRTVGSWLGLVEGANGEAGIALEKFAATYLHRNTGGLSHANPKADKVSIQIVAIPRSELEYVYAAEDAGGQAADVDAAMTLDLTIREDAPFNHDPAGDTSEVRALLLGSWALCFASGYASPLGGARNTANRLSHRISLQRDGSSLAQCGGMAHNRGNQGCEVAGFNAHGIVQLDAGADLSAALENLSTVTDANVDMTGRTPGTTEFFGKLQAIRLRALGQSPSPAILHVAAPASTRSVQLNPAAAVAQVVAAPVVRTVQLNPTPATLGVVSPAVARLVTLTPSSALLGVIAPQVARLVTLTPQPAVIPLVVPSVARLLTLTPDAAVLPLVVPAVARLGAQTPGPAIVEVRAGMVARLLTLTPSPAELHEAVPPVTRAVTFTPGSADIGVVAPLVTRRVDMRPTPAALDVSAPPAARRLDVVPAPAALAVVAPDVARLLTLTPSGTELAVVSPTVARLVTLTPLPVELLVIVPEPTLGMIVLVELALELARTAALPAGLALTASIAAALERAVAAQAALARGVELGSELATSPELDTLLQLAVDVATSDPAAAELGAGVDVAGELRANVNRSARSYAALLSVAQVEHDFARVLARVVRLE